MPRGRKPKLKFSLNMKPDTAKSVFALVFILSAGVSFISFFAGDYLINSKIQNILKGSFGFSSIIVPVILLLFGLLLIKPIKFKYKNYRVLFGLIFLLITSAAFFHIFYDSKAALKAAENGSGGGFVGYKISSILKDSISIYGALLVLLCGLVSSFVLILDISLDQILSFISNIKFFSGLGFFKKKQTISGSVTISSGTDVLTEQFHDTLTDVKTKKNEKTSSVEEQEAEDKIEETFEIIPSLSEPVSADITAEMPKTGSAAIPFSKLPYSDKVWECPPLELLNDPDETPIDRGDVQERAKIIVDTLKSFGINVEVVEIKSGPSVTQYALEAETGTKISKISNLQYDLALALASPTGSVRIEAPIPGKSLIGIEVPNNSRATVNFKSLLTSEPMKALKSKLGIVLGKDVGGLTRVYDISKMPHVLLAGATGSGKSVFIHSIIFSILYRASPQEVKFILIDPKRVELIHYQDIPHLLVPVVTDVEKTPFVFKWAVAEMERRYKLFEAAKARNIDAYNEKSGFQALPYIVIIIDELAEIMIIDPATVEKNIIRIAQLARATGIHLVLSVQRPSTNVITGLIKANIPARIAFNVTSQIDSRVIIDQPGAEKLLGKGDMLFVPPDVPKPVRLQGAYVADKEITKLVAYLRNTGVNPDYKMEIFNVAQRVNKSVSAGGDSVDEFFDEAIEIVRSSGKASASLLQRRLSIGYARAARILDELEQKGIISQANGSKPREVLIKRETIDYGDSSEDPLTSIQ